MESESIEKKPAGNAGSEHHDNDEKVNRLGTGKIWPLVIEFAIPAIIGMLVNAAYNLISAAFLGQALGTIGVSVTQVAQPIMTIFLAIAMMVGAGGNALCALRLGAGKHDEAEHVLGNTVTLSVIIAAIVAVFAMFPSVLDWILTISSCTEEIRPYAAIYIQIICFGYVLQCIGFGVNNFIRTAGAPNRALLTMVIGAAVCIVCNYFFVLVFDWGAAGSAAATLVGQGASCVSVLWYFLFTKGTPLKLRGRCLKLSAPIAKQIFALGAASFCVQIAAAVLSFATNFLLVKYGAMSAIGESAALASIGLVQRVGMFAVMPLIGVATAVQPILGFNYGAKLYGRVRTTVFDGMILATVFSVIMSAIIHIFPDEIIAFFGLTDPSLMEFAVFALKVQMLMIPIVGAQIVGSNYFQATGQPAKSIILSLSRQVLILLPLMFLLPEWLPIFTSFSALDSICIAMPISDFLSCLLTASFDVVELRRLSRIEHHQPAPQY